MHVVVNSSETSLSVSPGQIITIGERGPQGATGPAGPSSDAHYVHAQNSPNVLWTITHNLNKYPSVSVVDSGETIVIGTVTYLSVNSLKIEFSSAFSGKAYLN